MLTSSVVNAVRPQMAKLSVLVICYPSADILFFTILLFEILLQQRQAFSNRFKNLHMFELGTASAAGMLHHII